jgi:hypothetical protein
MMGKVKGGALEREVMAKGETAIEAMPGKKPADNAIRLRDSAPLPHNQRVSVWIMAHSEVLARAGKR